MSALIQELGQPDLLSPSRAPPASRRRASMAGFSLVAAYETTLATTTDPIPQCSDSFDVVIPKAMMLPSTSLPKTKAARNANLDNKSSVGVGSCRDRREKAVIILA